MKTNATTHLHIPRRLLSLAALLALALLLSACETAEVRNLRIIKEAQDRRIHELQKEIDDNARAQLTESRKMQNLVDSASDLARTRDIELKKAQASDLKARNDLKIAQEKATASVEAVKRQLASANNEIARLNTELGRGQAELTSLAEEKRIIESAGDELQGEIQRYSQSEASLKEKLAAAEAKRDTLDGVVSDLKDTLAKREQDLKAKERLLAEANDALEAEKKRSGSNETKSSDIAKEKQALEKKNADLLNQIDKMRGDGTSSDSNLRDSVKLLADSLKPLSDRDYAYVATDSRGVVISISVDYLFEKDSIALDKDTLVTLDKIAEIINRYPESYVEVQGHTDNTPVANLPFADNWSLAAARSSSVVRYLSQGKRIAPERLKSVACAQYRPPTSMPENLQNKMERRVDIILSTRP